MKKPFLNINKIRNIFYQLENFIPNNTNFENYLEIISNSFYNNLNVFNLYLPIFNLINNIPTFNFQNNNLKSQNLNILKGKIKLIKDSLEQQILLKSFKDLNISLFKLINKIENLLIL